MDYKWLPLPNCIEKNFNPKLYGNRVDYTAWSLWVIVKHRCRKFHRQNVVRLNLCSYKIVGWTWSILHQLKPSSYLRRGKSTHESRSVVHRVAEMGKVSPLLHPVQGSSGARTSPLFLRSNLLLFWCSWTPLPWRARSPCGAHATPHGVADSRTYLTECFNIWI